MILDKVRRVIRQGPKEARLSPCEFTVMEKIIREDGGYVSMSNLILFVYMGSIEPPGAYKNVGIFLFRIRQKMKAIGTGDKLISAWRDGVRYEQAA